MRPHLCEQGFWFEASHRVVSAFFLALPPRAFFFLPAASSPPSSSGTQPFAIAASSSLCFSMSGIAHAAAGSS
jgi:hypothetical protein